MTGATIEEGHLAYNGVMGVFLEEASVSHSKASRDPVESEAAVEEGFCLRAQLQGSSLEEQNQSAVQRTDLQLQGNTVRSRAGLEGTVLRRSCHPGGKRRVGGKGF